MAPVDKIDHSVVEEQIKDIVQDLYELMVQANSYDNVGTGIKSKDILQNTINRLHTSLTTLYTTSSSASFPPIHVPPELLQYVDQGRNPDIYTREFVELARRGNQLMLGKERAFQSFRDVLAREMVVALPELRADVEAVVHATGGGAEVGDDLADVGVGAAPAPVPVPVVGMKSEDEEIDVGDVKKEVI